MRYLELCVTDIPDTDIRPGDPLMRTEWIHRDHIETIEPYTAPDRAHHMLWLQITLTSGRTRYIPLRPVHPDQVDDVARHMIATLIDTGTEPLRAAALTDPPDGTDFDDARKR